MDRDATLQEAAWSRLIGGTLLKTALDYLVARAKEPGTRSGVASLGLLVMLGALFFGLDVDGLVSQLEGFAAKVALAVATLANVARIIVPEKAPAVVAEVDGTLGEMRDQLAELRSMMKSIRP